MAFKFLMIDQILEVLLSFESQKDRNPEELREILIYHNIKTIEIWYDRYVQDGYILE